MSGKPAMNKMKKLLRALVILLIICGVPAVIYYVMLFTDYGCFNTFFPSTARLTRITNIAFPPSTDNLEWHCLPGLDRTFVISFRFTISPSDVQSFITASNAYSWDFYGANYLFMLFDDPRAAEQSSAEFTAWQAGSTCGWTNFLIAMDDPDVYTVYADHKSWDHCAEY